MEPTLKAHIEAALDQFTQGEYYQVLLEAKEEYFLLTGKINEDDEDFESRMNSFNNWYLFQFNPRRSKQTLIKDYLDQKEITGDERLSLGQVTFSLFEYKGSSISGQKQLFDILHSKNLYLPKEVLMPAIVKNDIFIGRYLSYKGINYLLDGLCILPKEIRSLLGQNAKIIRRLDDIVQEKSFLLRVEALKTKWIRYGHIDANKIFKFGVPGL